MIRSSSLHSIAKIEDPQEKVQASFKNMTLRRPYGLSEEDPHQDLTQNVNVVFQRAAQLGFQYHREGQYTKSLHYFGIALRQKDRTPRWLPKKAAILITIANFHSSQHDSIKSIHALEYSLEMLIAYFGPKSHPVAMVMEKLAEEYASIDQPETAVELLCESLAVTLARRRTRPVTSIWRALGRQLMTLGLMDDAQTCFDEANQSFYESRES